MDREIRQKLSAWLDAHWDALLEDLKTLVRIPSVARYDDPDTPYGPDCKKALDTALELGEKYGFTTENYENRCGSMSLRPSEHEIGFWGHLDVVPVGNDWTFTKPFEPLMKDDYLIGRGSDDNKGPLVGVMYLLRAFEELNIPTRHGLRLFCGCDEEKGMSDAIWFAQTHKPSDLTIIPDCGFPVCYGEKGILTLDLVSDEPMPSVLELSGGMASNIVPDQARMLLRGTCPASDAQWASSCEEDGNMRFNGRGIPRHSASPEGGVNAIREMMLLAESSPLLTEPEAKVMHFLRTVNDDFLGTALNAQGEDEVSGPTTCTGTMCSLDAQGRVHLHLNIRYSISRKGEDIAEKVQASAMAHHCHTEQVHNSAAHYYPRESPLVDRMTQVYNEITGEEKSPYVMGGGTYARKLPNAIGFGLGGMKRDESMFEPGHGGAHQADEGLYLPNYRKALEIFAMGILEADALLD